MIYGSVCSGIEAATMAWHPLGWKASFFSEIEKFPRQVLAHHYPDTPLHGDFTTIQKGDYEPIELLVGGTPCQSFSVAGLRAGLNDPRGNLMLEFGALAKRLQPKWLVWENVPGVLSSNGGRDFTAFLDMLELLGYIIDCDILDAQFHGVPQRRRRVFVCAQHRDDLLNQMTDSSALTIAQCLQEILQAILVETQKVSLKEPIKSELAYLSKDGVMRRMELFGMLGETNSLKLLQRNLIEAFHRCQKEQNQLDAHLGEKEKELIQIDQLMDSRMESQFTLTEQSLKNVLEESLEVMRLFTTLTGTNTITPMQIYTCSQAVLHIEKLIQLLSKSCPPYWNAELSSLTSLEEYTNYARQTSSDIFGDMDRFQAWCDFIRKAEHTNDFIRDSNKNGSAAAVLFERDSLQGNPAPSRETGEEVARTITMCTGISRNNHEECVVGALDTEYGFQKASHQSISAGHIIPIGYREADLANFKEDDAAGTLKRSGGVLGGGSESIITCNPTYALAANTIGRKPENGGNGARYSEDLSYTLTKTDQHAVATKMQVRRLTPRECERLQGFPDDFTNIPGASDSARYKALGNSMAVPVMRWIGERINLIENLQ